MPHDVFAKFVQHHRPGGLVYTVSGCRVARLAGTVVTVYVRVRVAGVFGNGILRATLDEVFWSASSEVVWE